MLVVQEEKRRFIDMTIAYGRKKLSPQTGFVHHCYEVDERAHDTIPLFENFCYAFALFRSRLSEDIAEAKSILERLLAFEVNGSFPVYLHEYPQCRNRALSLEILPIFVHIERLFRSILGESLREKLHDVQKRMFDYLDEEHKRFPFPLHLWMRRRVLESLVIDRSLFRPPRFKPRSSTDLSAYMIAIQLLRDSAEEDVNWLSHQWNEKLGLYCGPQGRESYFEQYPAPTLFDLFMAQWSGIVPERLKKDHPILFQAALVLPFSSPFPCHPQNSPYFILQEENPAFSLFWGTADEPHSLILHEGMAKVTAKKHKGGFRCSFHLSESLPEEGEGRMECGLFLDHDSSHQILVNGKQATTFHLGDQLELFTQNKRICSFHVKLKHGEGIFCGHLSRANRPRQLALKGGRRHNAYDTWISLRTIRRSSDCIIEIIFDSLV